MLTACSSIIPIYELNHQESESHVPLWLPKAIDKIEQFPRSRILSFKYTFKEVHELDDLLDVETLRHLAKSLSNCYPLCQVQPLGSNEEITGYASAVQRESTQQQRPVIFICHGFGGLIYEQVRIV